jgi:hypothetical protein
VPGTGYSRARWQLDAHHLMRSSGDRLVKTRGVGRLGQPARSTGCGRRFNLTRSTTSSTTSASASSCDAKGRLPPTFMLLPPHSWHPDVWTDVAQMLSANTLQAPGGEQHLCPLPFDIADRLIAQFSMPGELVFDPFMGLGTVPMRAMKPAGAGRAWS